VPPNISEPCKGDLTDGSPLQGSSLLVSQPRALPWATVSPAVGAPDSYAHTTFNRTLFHPRKNLPLEGLSIVH